MCKINRSLIRGLSQGYRPRRTTFTNNIISEALHHPRHANNEMVIVNNLVYDARFGPQVEDGRSKTGPLTSTVAGNYILETATSR